MKSPLRFSFFIKKLYSVFVWIRGRVVKGSKLLISYLRIAKARNCQLYVFINLNKYFILILRNLFVLQSNTIRNNLLSGINIEVGVCCTILKNGIYDNKEHGVATGGLGALKMNDVVAHALPALLVRPCGNVSVERNRLHSWSCHRRPVRIEEKSRVVFEANEFLVTLPPPLTPPPASSSKQRHQQEQGMYL